MAKEYVVKKVWGKYCVFTRNYRKEYNSYEGQTYYTPAADFFHDKTFWALCGRLHTGQSLENWKKENDIK